MNEPVLVTSIALTALFLLGAIKIYILFRAARRKTFRRWFYFTQQEIVEAPTPRATTLRKTQNTLTAVFFILAAIAVLLLYLFSK